jgi:8-oxo-dGTP diphosphatase
MNIHNYSHKVAVTAYILRENKFLLLKRTTPPKIWAPPGGRLKKNEDPIIGLKREIKEETNLKINVIAPANTWFGKWENQYLLSIDFLVEIIGGSLSLSQEHSESIWISIDQLRKGKPIELDPLLGFKIRDFENAAHLNKLLQNLKSKKQKI